MTGTDLCVNKPHLVPVIFEPPCIFTYGIDVKFLSQGKTAQIFETN